MHALEHPSQAKSYHRETEQVSFDIVFLERESTNARPPEWIILDTPQEEAGQAIQTSLKRFADQCIIFPKSVRHRCRI